MSLTSDELHRYARHVVLPQVGIAGQERLKAASVLVVGLGGLGSPAALYLAAAGVGRVGLMDFDQVDESNLQRQVLHGTASIGVAKVESARARLHDLNPHVALDVHDVRLTTANALGLIGSYDVVVDGTDSFAARYLINDACVITGTPNVHGSVHRFEGQVKLVFKFYPLSGHPRGEPAARAAVAAQNQGKFWEMHHLIFENQLALEQADLEKYAKQLGLDLPKFKADLVSKETGERVAKDKNQADGLGLQGTPMIYIGGREVDLALLATDSDLEDWVKLDIELAGKVAKPKGPPIGGGAGSAAPAAGSAALYPPRLLPSGAPASAASTAVPSLAVPKK
ncbi:MAG: ThiF family adenylyltransferase [Deltaproteobacteria bacterium]